MANRYWVGGSGTWDDSSTTHWSTTSGGSAGASAPTGSDVCIFNSSSGGGTITVSAYDGGNSFTINASGFTGAFSGALAINPAASTIGSTATFSSLALTLSCLGSGGTLTTSGKTFGSITVRGDSAFGGAYITLVGALNTVGNLRFLSSDYVAELRLDTVTNSIAGIECNPPYDPFSTGLKSSIISKTTGTQATLSCSTGTNTLSYLAAKDINFTGGAIWLVGTAFIDNGNNTGLTTGTSAFSLFFGGL